jgi:hypothetical protein
MIASFPFSTALPSEFRLALALKLQPKRLALKKAAPRTAIHVRALILFLLFSFGT